MREGDPSVGGLLGLLVEERSSGVCPTGTDLAFGHPSVIVIALGECDRRP